MKNAWRLVGGGIFAIGMSASTFAWAQEPFAAAPIVDSSDKYNEVNRANVAHDAYDAVPSANQPRQSYDTAPSISSGPRSSGESEQTFLLNKINALQQEVQKLRGQLEVQAHDLKLLSQQQEAYYKDLDQRLAQARTLSSGVKTAENKAVENKIPENKIAEKQMIEAKAPPISATPESSTANAKPETVKPIASTASSENNEQAQYAAAYDLIQQKKYQEAEKSLDAFLAKYPESEYVSNVYYWLGEIYLEQKRTDKAVDVFKTVVNQYPQSPKVSVAMFKLGMAYFEQGRTEEAQVELQKVQQQFPDTSAARLASAKLKEIGTVNLVS